MDEVKETFVFVNLIDTDQLFGHRLDPEGYAGSLKEFDYALPEIFAKIDEDDLLIITGDHGNDPCSTSTDHSREFVPLLVYPKTSTHHEPSFSQVKRSQISGLENNIRQTGDPSDGEIDLGTRETFADVASSIAIFFGLENTFPGKSFL